MAIRAINRVSEEYIRDPLTGLYYWLAPVYKRTTETQMLDDMNKQVEELRKLPPQGEQVRRPTTMLLKSQVSALQPATQGRLGENTYLMFFDPGVAKPAEIPDPTPGKEWLSEGNNIFLWSSNKIIYTWCDSNMLGHRYYRVSEAVALKDAFEKPTDPVTPPPPEDPVIPGPEAKGCLTKLIDILKILGG